ncbi:MAG: KUP/HAK/KT family potassium transporter [Betaproteobacteria bacterium]|nr:KUP/HAK/KT family potassium transporter [Betaproteobacteria bacterium]
MRTRQAMRPPVRGHDPRVQALALAALGVVFGDIGTSPLYAMKEVFSEAYAVTATHDHVLGAVSLVLWSLMLVVSVKYVMFIMHADNRGEGGIMALIALVLRERVFLLTVVIADVPYVAHDQRIAVEPLGNGFYRVLIHFGFRDIPDVPAAMAHLPAVGHPFEMMATSFFLSRETVVPTVRAGMALWRERLFATMARNAGSAAAYFRLPPNRVIELGTQVEI